MSVRDPFVCITPRSNVFGWPATIKKDGRPNTPEVVSYLPLSDVLADDSESDIHFTAYSVTDVPHRLTKGAEKLIDGGVNMVLLVYDVDCPKSLRVDGMAPDAWWQSELILLESLRASEPELLIYRTRGGYRIVGLLPEPFVITDAATTHAWSEIYVLVGASLHLRYGIRTDPKCRDWQHLQRCPHALRTVGEPPREEREPGVIIGDPKNVGAWNLDVIDFAQALEHMQLLAAEHKPWGEALRSLELPTTGIDGEIVSTPRPATEESAYEEVIDALVHPVSKVGEGGGRHSMYLALSGVLYDRGIPGNVLADVIGQISIRAGVDEARLTQDRIKGARSTVARAEAGGLHTRIGSLVTYYPEVAAALDRVLPPKRAKADEVILRALTRKKAEAAPALVPALVLGSDVEVAGIVLHQLKTEHVQVVYTREQFWMCNGENVWRPDGSRALELKIHELDGAPYGQKASFKANQGPVMGAVKRAATLVAEPAWFDEAPSGIAFQNGFLEVKGAEMSFEELTPLHKATTVLPFAYDPDAECPRWLRYLSEVFRDDEDANEKITLLRQFVGACLVGAAPKFQASLVLEGGGDNGKSVFLYVVGALFPPSVRASIPPQKFEQEYYLAKLAGIRINLVAETPRTNIDNSEGFKKLTSGDVTTGRHPKGQPFDYIPILGNIFACNEMPGTTDQSHGFWKRWLLVRFGRTFTREEMDRDLKDKIVAEEMPGIARWAVNGALEALAQGNYSIPASSIESREKWRKDSDQVVQFSEERLSPVVDTERWAAGSVVYRAYREWSLENSYKPLNNAHFSKRLESLGFQRRRPKGSEWNVRVLARDGVGKVFRAG